MAGREVHIVKIGNIPCRNYYTAAIGIILDCIHSLLYLVNETSVVVGP